MGRRSRWQDPACAGPQISRYPPGGSHAAPAARPPVFRLLPRASRTYDAKHRGVGKRGLELDERFDPRPGRGGAHLLRARSAGPRRARPAARRDPRPSPGRLPRLRGTRAARWRGRGGIAPKGRGGLVVTRVRRALLLALRHAQRARDGRVGALGGRARRHADPGAASYSISARWRSMSASMSRGSSPDAPAARSVAIMPTSDSPLHHVCDPLCDGLIRILVVAHELGDDSPQLLRTRSPLIARGHSPKRGDQAQGLRRSGPRLGRVHGELDAGGLVVAHAATIRANAVAIAAPLADDGLAVL
jgi:hypothetical protein